LTERAREEEARKIEPIVKTYLAGETIIRRGQIITPLAWEALAAYNLIQPRSQQENLLAAFSLIGLITVFTGLYFNRRKMPLVENLKGLLLLSITFLVFLYGAKIVIPNRTVLPYIYPIPAFALSLASLFSLEAGLIFPMILSILAAYGLPNSLDLTLYYLLTSMIGVLVMGRGRRIANYFWAGVAIGLSGTAIILAYRLPDTITDLLGIATLSGAAFLNGLASASLTLLLQFLFACDRGNPMLAERYDVLAPAPLALLRDLVERCRAAGVPLTLCGEMASRPLEAMALVGLGIRRLSVAPSEVGAVKATIRSLEAGRLAAYLESLLGLPDRSLRGRLLAWARDHEVVLPPGTGIAT
jgi:hypothetical protein